MEQNLSEKERKQRLVLGLSLSAVSITLYSLSEMIVLPVAIAVLAVGFIFNYFTCFCGTKKFIGEIKEKL